MRLGDSKQGHAPTDISDTWLFRALHIHCFVHVYRVITSLRPEDFFRKVNFPIFARIERILHTSRPHALFWNLLFTFLPHLSAGILITLIHASLNLMVPELIRQFMHFMKVAHLEARETSTFIQKFIVIQLLRIFFAEHTKRLFVELAVKVESTLARKLISKSLRMAHESRYHIPETEIIQLSNVDLKLVFNLFQNMHMFFQAPFTIIVAIIMLFTENSHYGFIGVYWFLIAFLLQRELDGRMMHCNTTKLGLIAKRSNLNYDMFDKIREAKIIGWEQLLTEKNNDLFIEENHDHDIFYYYMTLYDISLLMLPIFVVSTITLYDMNEEDPITVEQVYVMLSLLGMCYQPMKSIRTSSINIHDGLHSLKRIAKYFKLSEEIKSSLNDNTQGEVGQVTIQQGTIATYPIVQAKHDFDLQVNVTITLERGERLCLLGKKRAGLSSFLEMLVGNLKKVRGKVYIRGRVAYMQEGLFFLRDTILENIRFFNKNATDVEIEEIYNELGLSRHFRPYGDLETLLLDPNKFSYSSLKRVALARTLLADADIYIIDSPFAELSLDAKNVVEQKLRALEDKGKTVILSFKELQFASRNDQIVIMEQGRIDEYGRFTDLVNCIESNLPMFFKSNEGGCDLYNQGRAEEHFFGKVRSAMNFDIKSVRSRKSFMSKSRILSAASGRSQLTAPQVKLEQRREFRSANSNFERLVLRFLKAVPFGESVFIFLIILAAEVLHIFIHFYIGHLGEEHGSDDYNKYKNLMIVEVVLTFCLAGLLYLEGEFSTLIAIIIGNKVYEGSFRELTDKPIRWHANQHNVQLADYYNHDYEQIYIACHSIYGIYKNLVILIATVEFISTNRATLAALMLVLSFFYYTIFFVFRRVYYEIVKHYYECKYNYVRCFEESIEGAGVVRVWGIKKQVMSRAQRKYQMLAAYKMSEVYAGQALSLICDVLSISLLALGLEYGIEMKMHHHDQSISMIATSIFLLMNMSEVLKTIISELLNFQSFFSINLAPFMEIGDKQRIKLPSTNQLINIPLVPSQFHGHRLEFNNLLLEEAGQPVRHNELFSLVIEEGEIVLLYENDNRSRELLLLGLTKNLPMFTTPTFYKPRSSNIKIGGVDIRSVTKEAWHTQIGVFTSNNFIFNGTIRENISWRLADFDEEQAAEYAQMLKVQKSLQNVQEDILSTQINITNRRVHYLLIRKIALLRILVRKPKIVIIKDTDEFIETLYVTEVLKNELPGVTIIKINNHLETSFDVTRVVAMERFKILEDGDPQQIRNRQSKVGEEMRDLNIANYKFMKMAKSDELTPLRSGIYRHDSQSGAGYKPLFLSQDSNIATPNSFGGNLTPNSFGSLPTPNGFGNLASPNSFGSLETPNSWGNPTPTL